LPETTQQEKKESKNVVVRGKEREGRANRRKKGGKSRQEKPIGEVPARHHRGRKKTLPLPHASAKEEKRTRPLQKGKDDIFLSRVRGKRNVAGGRRGKGSGRVRKRKQTETCWV